jgi:trans-2-enoyl-CoA reductase
MKKAQDNTEIKDQIGNISKPLLGDVFSDELIERINKYARHQYNRGQLDLPLISFEEWVNIA